MGRKKPHNSYYVVDSGGKIRRCAPESCTIIHFFELGKEKTPMPRLLFTSRRIDDFCGIPLDFL